jgi:hypothetical protein
MASGALQWQRYFDSVGGASSVIMPGATDRATFRRWS